VLANVVIGRISGLFGRKNECLVLVDSSWLWNALVDVSFARMIAYFGECDRRFRRNVTARFGLS
jgi:hypothetical protein